MRHNKNLVRELHASQPPARKPKAPYLAALQQLSKKVPNVRAAFNNFGHVRTIAGTIAQPLFSEPMTGTPVQQAQAFLQSSEIRQALALRYVQLGQPEVTDMGGLGYRVSFPQQLSAADQTTLPVHNGAVDVFLDSQGKVFNVNCTLRHGRRRRDLSKIISKDEAIAAAQNHLGLTALASQRAELSFAAHHNHIEPVYNVVIAADQPRQVAQVKVDAAHGRILSVTNLLRFAGKPRRNTPAQAASSVAAKAFLRIPDPNTAIAKQVFDVVLESLPNPNVLANNHVAIYLGSTKKKPVKAKPDGTFNYMPNDPEFSAVVIFFALSIQLELMKTWGLKAPTEQIAVFVEDHNVQDNAYFDPEMYEIHIGVGSGLNRGGLTRYIAYDIGVTWHENGHHIVFLQTPGNDLPGAEGGALHESIGDVLGSLVMDWWFRSRFAKQLGTTISVADVEADRRVIGGFALPPDGIRIQKNTNRTPQDKTGEVHDDGLISGGAQADLLVEMVKQAGVEPGIEAFSRLTLVALQLVPRSKVTFADMLNAYITADNQISAGANNAVITKAFADHGITLPAPKSGGGLTPIIIILK